MARKHLKYDEKLGKFIKLEQPSVEQLPSQLVGLPSSFVTKDTSDPDRIHALDDSHIVEALTREQGLKEQTPEKVKSDDILTGIDLSNGPLTQLHVDLIRFKVIKNMIDSNLRILNDGGAAPFNLRRTYHLWFPHARLDPRELREGRPPLKTDRPHHLRDFDLVVDAYNWPPRIIDMLMAKGIEIPNVAAMEAQMAKVSSLVTH